MPIDSRPLDIDKANDCVVQGPKFDTEGAHHGPLTETGDLAFSAMVALAESMNLPLRFKRDLYVHDRRACMGSMDLAARLDRWDGPTFAWGINENSTVFIPAEGNENSPINIDDAGEGFLWCYFDGRTLLRGSVTWVTRKLQNDREQAAFLAAERRRTEVR